MIPGFFSNEVQNLKTKPTETGDLVDYAEIPGFFSNEVQNLKTKPTETGDLVDYAEIPGFSGEIVKLRMIVEKKPGILNLWKTPLIATRTIVPEQIELIDAPSLQREPPFLPTIEDTYW